MFYAIAAYRSIESHIRATRYESGSDKRAHYENRAEFYRNAAPLYTDRQPRISAARSAHGEI
jgi:hypothetical protein